MQTMVRSQTIKFVMPFCISFNTDGYNYYFVYPLSLCDKNGEYFLVYFGM
jgi:Na+/H+-dicarboxylate symporter